MLDLREQESPDDARVTRDSAIIPRWPSAAILDTIEPEIAPFHPPTPKPLLELDLEWIGFTVCDIFTFKLYCDLETAVWGHSRSLSECYTIRSADPENLILEPSIMPIGKAVAKLWPFLYIQDRRQPPTDRRTDGIGVAYTRYSIYAIARKKEWSGAERGAKRCRAGTERGAD